MCAHTHICVYIIFVHDFRQKRKYYDIMLAAAASIYWYPTKQMLDRYNFWSLAKSCFCFKCSKNFDLSKFVGNLTNYRGPVSELLRPRQIWKQVLFWCLLSCSKTKYTNSVLQEIEYQIQYDKLINLFHYQQIIGTE